MKKFITIFFIFSIAILNCEAKQKENFERINEDMITSQPYKVELIDNTTPQTQNSLTLKVANDTYLQSAKVGQKILFTLPSDVNLENSAKIKAGTKFSATIILKEKTAIGQKFKIIINEITFVDATNFIILSNPKNIAPLKSISAERILGKGAKVNGTFRLGTVISAVNLQSRGIKSEPDTTTAVGICIMLKTGKIAPKIKAGTIINITFEKNILSEIEYIK
ncbi:hypothetical protein IJ843_03270 [bacterium]|nr:hypothetical protein [bacterium]